MVLSKYTHILNNGTHSYIYSHLTKDIVKVSESILANIRTGQLDNLSEKTLEILRQKQIIVEDDRTSVNDFFLKIRDSTDTLFLKIMVTEDCNFRCSYCYQGNDKKSTKMSLDTINALVEWTQQQVSGKGYKKLSVSFYGGEPLMNVQAILELMYRFNNDICNLKDTSYSFVSNGYLLNTKDMEKFVSYGLDSYSISIDGDSTIHNIRRKTKNGKDTYERIIDNLCKVKKKFPELELSISVVLDKENSHSIGNLANTLLENGIDKNTIINYVPCKISFENSGHYNEYNIDNVEEKVAITRSIAKELSDCGVKQKNMICIPDGVCKISRNNYYVFDSSGNIFPCAALVGQQEYIIGNIYKPNVEFSFSSIKGSNFSDSECESCEYYPVCSGGCRVESFLINKNWHSKKCEKKLLKNLTENLLPIYIGIE